MGDTIRSLLRRTSSCHQPWQLSLAIAMGVVCGLLPKFSLLFCVVAVLCCGLPIHLPLAAVICCISSFFVGPLTQTAGRAGLWSLTSPSLVDMWSSLDSLPWLPWIGLHNSVVHGSLLIGLSIALPVFLLTKPLAVRLSPARRVESEMAVDPDFAHVVKPAVAADWSGSSALAKRSQSISVSVVDENTCHELEKLLATCNADQANDVGAAQVAQRAAQMVQYVDELLASTDFQPTPCSAPNPLDVPATKVKPSGVCQDSAATSLAANPAASPATTVVDASSSTRFIHQPQQQSVIQPYVQASGQARDAMDPRGTPHAGEAALHRHNSAAEVAKRRPVGDAHQAETLRYLLEHLRAIKDKV